MICWFISAFISLLHICFMPQFFFLTSFLLVLEALCSSTAPLVSRFGDSFRSGDVAVAIGSQPKYDFEVPFNSPLPSSSIALALSMVEYSQAMDSYRKIHYSLMENTPTSSNHTHAVFRVELGLVSKTSRAKVKYLACPTSILSTNFNIITSPTLFPDTL